RGLAQRWGAAIEDIRPGDVVLFPPGEKHWHGATATTAMTHIAVQERLHGKGGGWMGEGGGARDRAPPPRRAFPRLTRCRSCPEGMKRCGAEAGDAGPDRARLAAGPEALDRPDPGHP